MFGYNVQPVTWHCFAKLVAKRNPDLLKFRPKRTQGNKCILRMFTIVHFKINSTNIK